MQNVFSKIDRKILMTIGVILVVVLIASLFVYKYSKDVGETVQDDEEEAIIETSDDQIIAPNENLQIEPGLPAQPGPPAQPGLTICADKCGDGVCQPAGTVCADKLNCTCAETKADCPQDCK